MSDSDIRQLYAEAAPVLYASTRVAVTVGSGLIDLHLHASLTVHLSPRWEATTMLMLGLARKLPC